MSGKNNAATAAQQGLDDLMSMDEAAQDTGITAFTTSAGDADEELEEVNTGRVARYYTHKIKAGKAIKANQQVIKPGTTLLGRYAGSFVNEKSRFKSRTHKLALIGAQEGLSDGDVVGLASCGLFDKRFQFVPEGTKAQVRYQGMNVMKGGEYEGQDSYLYDLSISKRVNAEIKAGNTAKNYELKKKD